MDYLLHKFLGGKGSLPNFFYAGCYFYFLSSKNLFVAFFP